MTDDMHNWILPVWLSVDDLLLVTLVVIAANSLWVQRVNTWHSVVRSGRAWMQKLRRWKRLTRQYDYSVLCNEMFVEIARVCRWICATLLTLQVRVSTF